MDKFYVKAGFHESEMRYVGTYDSLGDAIRYSDNVCEVFSQGSPPQDVITVIHNNDESMMVKTVANNGYWSQVETTGV